MPSIWTDWDGVYRICNDLSASEDIDGPHDTIKITAYRPNQVRVDLTRRQAKRLKVTGLQKEYGSKKLRELARVELTDDT